MTLVVVTSTLLPVRADAAPAAPRPEVTGRAEPGGAGVGAGASDGAEPAVPPGPPGPRTRGGAGGGGAGGGGAGSGGDPDGGSGRAGGAGGGGTDHARVPACALNAPGEMVRDSLCNNATLTCPDPAAIRYRLYARPATDPGALWAAGGTQCLTPAQLAGAAPGAGAGPVAPVVVTLADFQRVPFAPGTPVLQPPGGQVLVNVPVHVHGAAQVQVLPTVVAGTAVQVRATPTAYAWDFGDGATAGPSPDPGAPWPAPGHEHAYAAPGARAVTMSTTYTGEFSVAGGPWQPIDGDVTIVSPAQPVLARTARASLVADLLG